MLCEGDILDDVIPGGVSGSSLRVVATQKSSFYSHSHQNATVFTESPMICWTSLKAAATEIAGMCKSDWAQSDRFSSDGHAQVAQELARSIQPEPMHCAGGSFVMHESGVAVQSDVK